MKLTIKNLLLMLLLSITFNVNAQKWFYNNGGNDFDGKCKFAKVRGEGGKFPYTDPYIEIVYWENSRILRIAIDDAGYSAATNPNVFFKFNGDATIYRIGVLGSTESSNWYLRDWGTEDDFITSEELLHKFKSHNTVAIRLQNDFKTIDLKFNLSGSSKAINFVIDNTVYNANTKLISSDDIIGRWKTTTSEYTLFSDGTEYVDLGSGEHEWARLYKIKAKTFIKKGQTVEIYNILENGSLKIYEKSTNQYNGMTLKPVKPDVHSDIPKNNLGASPQGIKKANTQGKNKPEPRVWGLTLKRMKSITTAPVSQN